MYTQHAKLIDAMIEYDKGDARRIQHFIKVHDLAATIAALENADEETTFILETAAILHDIGIHISEAKYGSASGHYQELEGPAEAEKLMQKVGGYNASQIERVMYLIGHHHTYNNIDGIDYQILVEADFLVNLYEDNVSAEAVKNARSQIFRTSAGTRLLDNMF
ncbi:putative uncharacterized protein [Bacteroides pectinophilus CAG:437]|uniref:HD domain-containing protein n=1 Tax=Bacteroides pectinophilus CAG:437 TaxID=1263051 RepID=R7AIF3_9FIRM|nr:putative uncharacterized protein [Bacteroides pectinophilus CAG:437]